MKKSAPIQPHIFIDIFKILKIKPKNWIWNLLDEDDPRARNYYRVLEYIKSLPVKICPRHEKPYHISIGWYGAKYECYDCLDENAQQYHRSR